MKNDLIIKNGIVIPGYEIELKASRSGGPGGQHVNKTSTRITLRWNARNTSVFNSEEKEKILKSLKGQLTESGELIIHSSSSRSQEQNKQFVLKQLKRNILKALIVPKKRLKTQIPSSLKEKRLETKAHRSYLKKLRSKKIGID